MKGLVIAVCCLVALAVAEEEKLAEMSVQPPVSSGALGGQPLFGGSGTVVGRQFMGLPGGYNQWLLPGGGLNQWLPGTGVNQLLPGGGVSQWWQGAGVNQLLPGGGIGSAFPPTLWNQGGLVPGGSFLAQPWFNQGGFLPGQGGFLGGNFGGGYPFLGGFAGQGLVGQQPLAAGAGGARVKGGLKK